MSKKAKILIVGFYIDEPDGPILINWYITNCKYLLEENKVWGYTTEELKEIAKIANTYYKSLEEFSIKFNEYTKPIRRYELRSVSIRTSRDSSK